MNPINIIVDRLIADGMRDLAAQVANCEPGDMVVIARILAETVVLATAEFPDSLWDALEARDLFVDGTTEVSIHDLCFMATLPGWPQVRMTTIDALPSPPDGSRWAQKAPPGSWTPEVRAEHAAEVRSWNDWSAANAALEHWNESKDKSDLGPRAASRIGCCVLADLDTVEVGPIEGAARTFGQRALFITADGAVWGEVALRRPSAFAGEEDEILLSGAFRIEFAESPMERWKARIDPLSPRNPYGEDDYMMKLTGPSGPVPLQQILDDPALIAALKRYGWAPDELADGRVRSSEASAPPSDCPGARSLRDWSLRD